MPAMEQQLDVTGLPPPQPLERVLDALADLAQDQMLRVQLDREPTPLYPMLSSMGYQWRGQPAPRGGFELLIWSQLSGGSPQDRCAI